MEITVDPTIPTLIYIVHGMVYTFPLELCNWSTGARETTPTTMTVESMPNVVITDAATHVSKRKFAKMSTVPRHLKPNNYIKIRAPPAFRASETEIEIKTEPDWFAH